MSVNIIEVRGRMKKFKTVEELRERIDTFYEYCEINEIPLNFERLATYLGVDRKTIWNYEHDDEFAPLITEVRDRILADLMERGLTGQINATFGIFCLKNYGYSDRQEVETVNTNLNKNVNLENLTDEQIDRILKGE